MMNNLTTDVYRGNRFVRHLNHLELEMAKKDICFYYEEQTRWATISGDLNFGYTFALPYWDYLDLRGSIDQADIEFVRTGSLLLLLSECLEFFEDSGTFYLADEEKLLMLTDAIKAFSTTDKKEIQIKDLILKLTERIVAKDNRWNKDWEAFLNKLVVTHIYGYFRNKLNTFDSHWEALFLKYRER